ncbi:MAG: alpha/beta superfamily hydrolase [Minisyncoccia bacterium]|jgi:alpha/beta superfamily hydrolase
MTETAVEHLELMTRDRVALQADLAVPDAAHAAAIICHPHPRYGGNRHNNVVQALFAALPAAGIAALRFDFRADFDGGRGEQLDAIAALNALEVRLPGLAIIATGYSFGAAIVSALDDVRITTKVLVAPPLASMPTVRGMEVPTLVLTPAHDQFSAPDATEAIISEWPQTTHETVASADHFLNGRTGLVAERAVAFITRTPCA